jgi:hypothetical protein
MNCSSWPSAFVTDDSLSKKHWTDTILSFFFLAYDADAFRQPTIEGAPSVHMPIHYTYNRPEVRRYSFKMLKASSHAVVSSSFFEVSL